MVSPIKKFDIEQMIDQENKPIPGLYVITLSKKLSRIGPDVFNSFMDSVGGVDALEPVGMYTVRIRIAKTFDSTAVLEELSQGLDRLHSDLTLPTQPGKVLHFPGAKV